MPRRRIVPRWATLVLALAALTIAATGNVARADKDLADSCHKPAWLEGDQAYLPHASKRVKQAGRLRVVALGSSSTVGTGGSGAAAAWPAGLQHELTQRLPGVEVSVLNKALQRQSVRQMVDRMTTDVEAERPDLVIWEAGTSEAVRGIDPESLASGLLEGIDRLTQRGIDVILMDMQYARPTARVINFDPYVEALSQAGLIRNVYVFARHAVMREWIEDEYVDFSEKQGKEAVVLADRVYACIAQLLADVIAASITR
ncbi:MAG TPA: SGNH/GDSL hydrolase family protein [Alphaproteobacteria bacterium]|nr:SGNH/GDSL hydrolase family protein [Alphaproteobacteria bacterium]